MSGSVVISIPNIRSNPAWFNNFITSIFYSQYSKELLIRDNKNGNGQNDYIFNAYLNADIGELNEINIKNTINDIAGKNLSEMLKNIKIEDNLYEYYLNNKKIFTSFILPKFIYYLGLTCISIEHYNKKNYVGLYDLVKYNSHKIVKKRGLFGFGNDEILTEYKLELDVSKKQNYIRRLYDKSIHPDYITVNKWFNKINIPSVLLNIEKMNENIDDDDNIDNIYRLSTTYKNKDDLKIDDKLQTEIIYNGYKYTLDSCIINNYNNDIIDDSSKDINYEDKIKENIVCLTNNNNRIIYSGSHIPKILCEKIYKFDWVNKNKFQIYSDFPCNIFEGISNGIPDEKLSIFDITLSNYTLIYVKHEKSIIEERTEIDRKRLADTAERKQKETIEKKEREERENDAKEKRKKYTELEELKVKFKEQEEKLKTNINKDDIDEIEKIINKCKSPIKAEQDLINECFNLLREYIKLLKYDESDFKGYTITNYMQKISDIVDKITKAKQLFDDKKKLPANRGAVNDKIDTYLKYYENLNKYLEGYIYYIINILSRQNIIKLLKDELVHLPKDTQVIQILDSISKLPNNDSLKKIEELLLPSDAKITQIIDLISKLPNDDKLKKKIEELLLPTNDKIAQILEAISKIPKDDNFKKLEDLLSNLPTDAKISDLLKNAFKDLPINNTTKELTDLLNATIKDLPKDARISEVLGEIAKINREDKTKDLLAAMVKIPDETKISELLKASIKDLPKEDNSKIIKDLNTKIDAMQQSLLSKINQENRKSKDISLQSEIAALNQQLELLGEVQRKISESGMRDNKQLLLDMQQELLKYSEKDNKQIIAGVQDLLRVFNEKIMTKRNDNENVKEQLLLLKDIQSKLNKESRSRSKSECKNKSNEENKLLKLENEELKKQIEIFKDIQSKCKKQQKEYERCNKHNTLPYKYIKFKEDELLEAIKEKFKGQNKPKDRIIIDFIFYYFEKNNKVMNVYIIEKYMGDIYDVMKIFNKKYNIENIDIKSFYRLLASISIYSRFYDDIKNLFPK
jgi:hypothetical protein